MLQLLHIDVEGQRFVEDVADRPLPLGTTDRDAGLPRLSRFLEIFQGVAMNAGKGFFTIGGAGMTRYIHTLLFCCDFIPSYGSSPCMALTLCIRGCKNS
jgi:hypothetical protein